jgi:hypothetical protein
MDDAMQDVEDIYATRFGENPAVATSLDHHSQPYFRERGSEESSTTTKISRFA